LHGSASAAVAAKGTLAFFQPISKPAFAVDANVVREAAFG